MINRLNLEKERFWIFWVPFALWSLAYDVITHSLVTNGFFHDWQIQLMLFVIVFSLSLMFSFKGLHLSSRENCLKYLSQAVLGCFALNLIIYSRLFFKFPLVNFVLFLMAALILEVFLFFLLNSCLAREFLSDDPLKAIKFIVIFNLGSIIIKLFFDNAMAPFNILFFFFILSLAILPIVFPKYWEYRQDDFFGFFLLFGRHFLPFSLHSYIPFIFLMSCVYVASAGIKIRFNFSNYFKNNFSYLATGFVLASFFGTMGTSALLIEPFLEANKNRKHTWHLVVFFIIIVANVGGILTPFGDPPLFSGMMEGVEFFWTLKNLWQPWLFLGSFSLVLFSIIDIFNGGLTKFIIDRRKGKFIFKGFKNFLLLSIVVFLNVLPIKNHWILNVLLLPLIWYFSDKEIMRENSFNLEPLLEIGKVFLVIFCLLDPVVSRIGFGFMLNNFKFDQHQVLWLSGFMSSFLDNVPTYLIFFKILGGKAAFLMNEGAVLLKALCLGTVCMGSLTYIGNAPNFLIKNIAEQKKIKVLNFFLYSLVASCFLLPPLYIIDKFFLV